MPAAHVLNKELSPGHSDVVVAVRLSWAGGGSSIGIVGQLATTTASSNMPPNMFLTNFSLDHWGGRGEGSFSHL